MSSRSQNSPRSHSLPTEELAGLRLLLRDDLVFTLQSHGGETCYVIEDVLHSAYFRIGCAEYTFLSLLNGKNSVEEAIAKAAIALGSDGITEQEATSICRWLIDNHLAATEQSSHSDRFSDLQRQSESGRWKRALNPLTLSFNLGNPTPFLNPLLPFFGWMYRPVGWLVWTCVLCLGGIRLLIDWRSIAHDSLPVIAPQNWLWLALVWCGLKVVHEISHGLCCLSYGGTVRVFGLNTVMFVPMPFVDVSSAWRLPSKWQRMHVAFAGIFVELLIASLAIFVRSYSDNPLLRMLCLQVALTGGVMTLFFNMNPLTRFDGYYIFSDWIELPNLAQIAQRLVMQMAKRVFFGVRFSNEDRPFRQTLLLATYGVIAACWKVLMTISMIFAAEKLFHGAGVPLAILSAVLWLALPIVRGLHYFVSANIVERPSRTRFVVISAATLSVCFVAGRSVLWQEELVLPAVVDFVPAETVRCTVAGFVSDVFVRPGQTVRAGDLLLQLANPQIDFEIAELEVEVARSQIRCQQFQTAGDIASRQTEDVTLTSLRTKLSEKRRSRDELTIRTPVSGIVIADDITNLPGQYLSSGEQVCVVGDAAEKNLRVVVSQSDLEATLGVRGETVVVRFRGAMHEPVSGTLTEVDPRASGQLIHPALAATAGGPLAVHAIPSQESSQRDTWELTQPCFIGTVMLSDDVRDRCGAGQLASVHLYLNRRTVADRVASAVEKWIDSKRSEVR